MSNGGQKPLQCPGARAVHPAVPWSATIVPAWPFPPSLAAGVKPSRLYQDHASGKKDDRPGLEACLKSLREADTLIVWKLDRLGRNLRHLVNTIHELMERKIGFRVLTGQGPTSTPRPPAAG